MDRHRLVGLIDQGESSTLEFKRDGLSIQRLVMDLVAFLNLQGGTVLVGVEDDGSISGTSRAGIEAWVAEACRTKIEPPVVPLLSWDAGARGEMVRIMRRCGSQVGLGPGTGCEDGVR